MTKATLSLMSEDDYVDDLTISILNDFTLVLQTHGTHFQAYIPREVVSQVYMALLEYVEDDTTQHSCLPEGAHLKRYTTPVVGKQGTTLLHQSMPPTLSLTQELSTSYAAIFEFKISKVPAQDVSTSYESQQNEELYEDNGVWISIDEAITILELIAMYASEYQIDPTLIAKEH